MEGGRKMRRKEVKMDEGEEGGGRGRREGVVVERDRKGWNSRDEEASG